MSDQEKVVGLKSYEGFSVFLELVACLDGLTRCFRFFLEFEKLHMFLVKAWGDRGEGVQR